MTKIIDLSNDRYAMKHAIIAGTSRALGLLVVEDEGRLSGRVPELLKQRGWPSQDIDLCSVIVAALAFKKLGAGKTLLRRPPNVDGCGGRWPVEMTSLPASRVVDELELADLLLAR